MICRAIALPQNQCISGRLRVDTADRVSSSWDIQNNRTARFYAITRHCHGGQV